MGEQDSIGDIMAKVGPMSPTFPFTLDVIVIPPICSVFAVPVQEMSWLSAVCESNFDTIIYGITHDFVL